MHNFQLYASNVEAIFVFKKVKDELVAFLKLFLCVYMTENVWKNQIKWTLKLITDSMKIFSLLASFFNNSIYSNSK